MPLIHWFGHDDLKGYRAAGDPVAAYLPKPGAAQTTGDRWLAESEPKRMIAWAVYGPLLRAQRRLRITDIGAGSASLLSAIASVHDYFPVDLDPGGLDWAELGPVVTDLVVSVDLFPNVDQRLNEFLLRWSGLPMRLVLTTYPDRWYRARRIDGDEILTVQAWTWEQARRVLARHFRFGPSEPPAGSLFANGRQVCLVST